jgi:histidine triad (HIT) family protein
MILTAKNMADIFKNKLGATWVNIINASGKDAEQSVFHFHFHLVPRYPDDWLKINDRRETKLQKIAIEELQKIAQQIQK